MLNLVNIVTNKTIVCNVSCFCCNVLHYIFHLRVYNIQLLPSYEVTIDSYQLERVASNCSSDESYMRGRHIGSPPVSAGIHVAHLFSLMCCVFCSALLVMCLVSLDRPFLIAPSVFSNVYLLYKWTSCCSLTPKNHFQLHVSLGSFPIYRRLLNGLTLSSFKHHDCVANLRLQYINGLKSYTICQIVIFLQVYSFFIAKTNHIINRESFCHNLIR